MNFKINEFINEFNYVLIHVCVYYCVCELCHEWIRWLNSWMNLSMCSVMYVCINMYYSPTKLKIITYAKNKNKTTRTRTTINRLVIQTQKKKLKESNYVYNLQAGRRMYQQRIEGEARNIISQNRNRSFVSKLFHYITILYYMNSIHTWFY